jgi:hypothetical protein
MIFDCCGDEMLCVENEGGRVCTHCGITYFMPVNVSTPSSETPTRRPFLYKRVHHFANWLKRIQAQDTRQIPTEVFELCKSSVDPAVIRGLMKNNGYMKYYHNIPSILLVLTGIQAPALSVALEAQLVRDFQSLELCFLMVKPKKRKNMLPYAYILYKLFEIHNIQSMFSVRISKSSSTLTYYDETWMKICSLLDWSFRNTVVKS